MPYSDNFLNEMYSASSAEPILSLIRVNIDGTLYYYVNNNESIQSTVADPNGLISKVYQPAGFKLILPEDVSDGTPRASLDFDPADNSVIRKLRGASNRIIVDLWLIAASSPNSVEFGPVNYESTDFKINVGGVTLGLEVEPILDIVIPGDRFTPTLFPGLWDREE